MDSIKIAVIGIAIVSVHNIFFTSLNETWATALNAVAILFIFIGIIGLFKNQR